MILRVVKYTFPVSHKNESLNQTLSIFEKDKEPLRGKSLKETYTEEKTAGDDINTNIFLELLKSDGSKLNKLGEINFKKDLNMKIVFSKHSRYLALFRETKVGNEKEMNVDLIKVNGNIKNAFELIEKNNEKQDNFDFDYQRISKVPYFDNVCFGENE